ncbi:MAG: MFS transporter [Anaerolineaceae bacterium]|nr:MAG: MFS transporter [Anaerolineaceae bacterium]
MVENRRAWLILAVISIPVFVGSLDLTVVSAFLPELINELNIDLVSLDSSAWVVTAYLLAYTISLVFMGRVSDLLGRRWVYAICLTTFIVGSILVAVAHQWPTDLLDEYYRRNGIRLLRGEVTLHAIIFGRTVQALGAGALVPVSLALVGDLFPPGQRAQPLGLVGAIDTLGWVLGHLYGGLFIQIMPWQGLFWMNVPLTLFALVVTLWALRRAPTFRAGGSFDWLGLLFISVALGALTIGLGGSIDIGGMTSFDQMSNIPPYAGELLLLSAVMFAAFIVVELYSVREVALNLFRRAKRSVRKVDPLIDIRLFVKRPNIGLGSVTNFFIGYCLFIGLVSVPIFVNVRIETSADLRGAALEVGLLLSALTVPMAIATIPGGLLSNRIGYRNAIFTGLSIAAVGFAAIWLTWHIDISYPLIMVEMMIVGIGLGLTFSPISASIINAADDHQRGMAGALVLILRLVGMTVSVSSLTPYALNRVAMIAGERGVGVDNLIQVAPEITVGVLGEFGLIGMVLCLIALIPAAFIRADQDVQSGPPAV